MKPTYEELEEKLKRLEGMEKALKEAEQNLLDKIAMWKLMLKQSREGIVILYPDGSVYEANQRFADMLGYSLEEAYGLSVWDWDAIFEREELQEMLRRVGDSGAHFETRHRRKDGKVIDVELSNNGTVYKGQKLILCICRDVTERNRMQEALIESEKRYQELSIIDDLTRLYNSRYFYSQLEKEVEISKRYDQPLSLMMIDLDDFKQFNDTYGHIEGDKVLYRMGQILKSSIRKSDTAFRYGGEEFLVLMPVTDIRNASMMAERIRKVVCGEIFQPGPGKEVSMTVSIGVAQYQEDIDGRELFRQVDSLMYEAKKEGKNRVCDLSRPGEKKQ